MTPGDSSFPQTTTISQLLRDAGSSPASSKMFALFSTVLRTGFPCVPISVSVLSSHCCFPCACFGKTVFPLVVEESKHISSEVSFYFCSTSPDSE